MSMSYNAEPIAHQRSTEAQQLVQCLGHVMKMDGNFVKCQLFCSKLQGKVRPIGRTNHKDGLLVTREMETV